MEQLGTIKNGVLAGLAAVVAVVAEHLGGWDVALQVLVGAMVTDFLMGLIVAGVFKRSAKSKSGALESRASFKGLMRKGCILLVVYLAVLLDRATGAAYIRTAVCLFFTANESLSILENLGLMGVPYPAFLKNMLQALKEQSDGAEGK